MQEMLAKMQAEMSQNKGINNNPPSNAPPPVPTTAPRSTTLPPQANGLYYNSGYLPSTCIYIQIESKHCIFSVVITSKIVQASDSCLALLIVLRTMCVQIKWSHRFFYRIKAKVQHHTTVHLRELDLSNNCSSVIYLDLKHLRKSFYTRTWNTSISMLSVTEATWFQAVVSVLTITLLNL